MNKFIIWFLVICAISLPFIVYGLKSHKGQPNKMAELIDSYSTSYYSDTGAVSGGTVPGRGQSFTGNGQQIGSSQFYVVQYGSPTGIINSKIYAHTGTFGVNGKPTGSALATSDDVDVSTLPTAGIDLQTFTFSGANQITLTNGTKYVVTIEYSGGDGLNFITVGLDTAYLLAPGNMAYDVGGWDGTNGVDVIFYVYDNTGGSTNSADISWLSR